MMLQRAGLAVENPSDFYDELLKAISRVESPEVQMVLSVWRPEKDMPSTKRREWERLWRKKLKSRHKEISLTATLSLLQPDLTDDPTARRGKLLDILTLLPEDIRIPTERIAPVPTPETIQIARPDRAIQSIARNESHPGRYR